MELCDKYLVDSININPPLNDYLLYAKYLKKQGVLPNYLSKKFNKKYVDLDQKYINAFNRWRT